MDVDKRRYAHCQLKAGVMPWSVESVLDFVVFIIINALVCTTPTPPNNDTVSETFDMTWLDGMLETVQVSKPM